MKRQLQIVARAMPSLGSLLAMIMNVTMIEKLLQKDIDDVATANTKFCVVLHSEQGPVEVEVRPGEPILVRLFTCPRVVGNGCLVPRTQWHLRCTSTKAAFKFHLGATTSNLGASWCFLNFLPLIGHAYVYPLNRCPAHARLLTPA